MVNKLSLLLLLVVGFFCGVIGERVFLVADLFSFNPQVPMPSINRHSLVEDRRYVVNKVRVIEGHVFDLYLENDRRYLVRLHDVVGTPPEAKSAVVRHFNEKQRLGTKPELIIKGWDNSHNQWLCELFFEAGSDETVSDFLRIRNLLYNR